MLVAGVRVNRVFVIRTGLEKSGPVFVLLATNLLGSIVVPT